MYVKTPGRFAAPSVLREPPVDPGSDELRKKCSRQCCSPRAVDAYTCVERDLKLECR